MTTQNLRWQPIETAPRDGTCILVCNFKNYSPETASWRVFHPNLHGKAAWRNFVGNKLTPTHWKPLPDEPTL